MQMFTGILLLKCMLWFPKANYFLKLQYKRNKTPVTEPNLRFRCPENKLLFFLTLTENTLLMLCVPRSCSCFSFQVPVVPGKLTRMAPSVVHRFYFSRTEMKEGKKMESENQKSKKKQRKSRCRAEFRM